MLRCHHFTNHFHFWADVESYFYQYKKKIYQGSKKSVRFVLIFLMLWPKKNLYINFIVNKNNNNNVNNDNKKKFEFSYYLIFFNLACLKRKPIKSHQYFFKKPKALLKNKFMPEKYQF